RDIYDTRIQVRLKRFIRPEQKFGSVEELKNQIRHDVESAIENS
ncbi:MAG: riboflavin kinase, partial [Ruminococcus sp.]|nr:riboflavin kinase [Ruminococcus sp.]